MAARLFQEPRRIVVYLPNLRAAVKHVRAFSSYNQRNSTDHYIYVDSGEPDDTTTIWPDKLGILGDKDSRFALPGLIGPSVALQPPVSAQSATPTITPRLITSEPLPDILTTPLPHQRQAAVLAQALTEQASEQIDEDVESLEKAIMKTTCSLECQITECSEALKRDFGGLFPGRDLSGEPLVVVTVCQKTDNDMTTWSPDVEEERDSLTELLVNGLGDVCTLLEQEGYWADFIDPSSGLPFRGDHTNTTLFETDERYRHFGFEIEDLGCCKVISHASWGTNVFVGSLFTNAPADHPLLKHLTSKSNWN